MPSVHRSWPLLLFNSVLFVHGLRCYTDIDATKSLSVECGLNTGCVKIYVDTEAMLMKRQTHYGYSFGFPAPEGVPPLPEKYMGNPVLRRGCFVLAVPDRCYMANNGLTYCWCSTKDLCNSATSFNFQKLRGGGAFVSLLMTSGMLAFTNVFMRRLLLRT